MHHYHIPEMTDVVIDDIPKMKTTTFVTSDPQNFMIVGSISEEMLFRVPADNSVTVKYKKSDVNAKGEGSDSLQEDVPKNQ